MFWFNFYKCTDILGNKKMVRPIYSIKLEKYDFFI